MTSTIGLKLKQNIVTLTVTNNEKIQQQIKQVINEQKEKERNAHY